MGIEASNADNKSVDTTGWMSAVEVSDHLGVSPNTVLGWKRKGKIRPPLKARRAHPTGGFRDVDVYDPRDVERIAAERKQTSAQDPGECAARVFEMLDAGASPRTIVTALRITPDQVEDLQERWLDLGGSDIVIGPVAHTELEKYVGSFDGIAGLVSRVAQLASKICDQKVTADSVDAAP